MTGGRSWGGIEGGSLGVAMVGVLGEGLGRGEVQVGSWGG